MNDVPHGPVESHSPSPQTSECSTSAFPGEEDAPRRIGDFAIVRVLGEGGMGTVYLADDVRLGRMAAVKTMRAELAARQEIRLRFDREARAAAAVEHENIVPVWQVGEAADGTPFIVMPFLQGETLDARLRREPIQPVVVVLKVVREVAEGLAAAHAKGLVHRDIKPGNVWIEGDPNASDLDLQVRRCKILDFGLARSAEGEDVHLTASGMVVGTPAYMAPEQARGEVVDHRADLFSLGVLYRMSTGRSPFAGANVMAVLSALAAVDPTPARTLNPDLPAALSDLIGRLMRKDPAARPRSATEVAKAAQRIETATRPGRRVAVLVGAALLALAALLPVGWWLAGLVLGGETDNGTLVVQIDDETEARVKNGKLILTGPDGKVHYMIPLTERDRRIESGTYKVRVEGADGLAVDTTEFTLTKGGKVAVRVKAAPRGATKNQDPDRTASEWVLSIGGWVRVNGEDREIKAVADLPQESFRLTIVVLGGNKQVSDEGLAHFSGCTNLMLLDVGGTKVSAAGLALQEPGVVFAGRNAGE
jgi:tRNA A-37 threonylcarbamoyl transferase component Bud32